MKRRRDWFRRDERPLPPDPSRVEFVCTGNICRSPFAEGAARGLGHPRDRVGSSGLWAQEGRPCPDEAVHAAARLGVDLAVHRARPATADRLAAAGWVVAMEFGHLRRLRELLSPEYRGQVILLGEFLPGGGAEIPDPFGRNVEVYDRIYETILRAVESLLGEVGEASG